jgi:hypothetical protein
MSEDITEVESAEVESQSVDEVSSPEVAEQTAAPQQQEVWGAFRNLPEFQGQDDRAIAQRLYEAMQREQSATRALQQYQSIVPVASEYLSNRELYEQWKSARDGASQQQPAPQQQAQQKPAEQSWWNPPQIKDSYRRYMTRDEAGREVISPDAPLDAKAALQDYMEYRAGFAQKFLDNPEQTLGPMVERVAMERAQAIVDERLGRMKDETFVQGLEQQNKDWLYDQEGRVSPEGLAVQKYIQDAKTLGIGGAQARWDYATKMVERDLLLANIQSFAQNQQQPQVPQQPVVQQPVAPQPTPEQQNMEYLRQQAMRTASRRTAVTTDARTPSKQMTFEERLLSTAQEQGLV